MKIASFRSEKTRVFKSPIHGKGLVAIKNIKKGEIVAIRSGHIIDKKTYLTKKKIIGDSDCQISENYFLAPLNTSEYKNVMIFMNHSCQPNTGILGNIIFVAIKDIAKNTEITLDYAFHKDNEKYSFRCSCGTPSCRAVITGKDWKIKKLQRKYKKYFSSYLQAKMT